MNIRISNLNDVTEIGNIHLSAFGESEGETIVELTNNFFRESNDYQYFSYVATEANELFGHIVFSEIKILDENIKAFILAPLAVKPVRQKMKVGSTLIKHGIENLRLKGTEIVFVYGDPAYYSKFGFLSKQSHLFIPPYKLQYPFGWQYLQLGKYPLPSSPVCLTCAPALRNPALW